MITMNRIVPKMVVVSAALLITQVPVISYTTPQTFYANSNIGTISPAVSNNPVPFIGYTTTLAGNGSPGYTNGLGSQAQFNQPLGTAVDGAGNIYVADAANQVIRMVTPAGQVTTFAGNSGQGLTNGAVANANFNHPVGMCVDGTGNIYIADEDNNVVRKISGGMVTTLAGTGSPGAQDGPAAQATFYQPCGVAVDGAGNVYVADNGNNKIRVISSASGQVSTLAGSGSVGSADATGVYASFYQPFSVALDPFGNLYVADRYNHKIRKIILATGAVSTVAGTGTGGYNGDGPALTTEFNYPTTIISDGSGNIYVTDYHNNRIRMLSPSGTVKTIAGSATAGSSPGVGTAATFNYPFAVSIDASGYLYVGDLNNNMIRKVATTAYGITPYLPAGLSFNLSTGVITGTPTAVSAAQNYTVSAYNSFGMGSTQLNITVLAPAIFPSQNLDYIITYAPRIAGYTTLPAVVTASANKTNVETTIEYFDGMGRPEQVVQAMGSPAGNDVVQAFNYDPNGREVLKYLPYALSTAMTSNGSFRTDALQSGAGLSNFYNPSGSSGSQLPNGLPRITSPYAGINYELSPLNRVIEQGAPGDPWQLSTSGVTGSGHTIHTASGANAANEVLLWNVNTTGGATGNTYYPAGTLSKTTTSDENGINTIQYKDNENKIVCKMVQNSISPVTYLTTYYIYNDFNDLSYVVPPLPAGTSLPATFAETDAVFMNFMYGYHYDARNRLIQKKIPGKSGWESVVYNTLDQAVLTQDAVQSSSNQWTVTKYDFHGRVIVTGLWNAGSTIPISTLQNSINAVAPWDNRDYTNNASVNPTGYVISSYPQLSNVLSISYYDDYNFGGKPYISTVTGVNPNATGLLTATKTVVLNTINNITPDMLWAVHYYDDLGRDQESCHQHYLGGTTSLGTNNYDDIAKSYDFSNELTGTIRHHYTKANLSVAAVTVANSYYYDHRGRKTQTWEAITVGSNLSSNPILLSQSDYNEAGQVMTKHLHSATGVAPFLQNTSYAYNERGWLSKINDPSVTPTATQLFAEQLNYNVPLYGATAQFNGNIAEQDYNAGISGRQQVKYSYDPLNRLQAGNSTTGFSETAISYDNLGNILSLTRAGTGNGTLTYGYTGDRLTTLIGFKAGTYGYDNNGNVNSDGPRGVSLVYNMLNLPQTATATGINITYTYDADGNKLKKVSGTTTTDYIKGIQYNNGVIAFIMTDEGRAINTGGSSYNYEYTLTDHLGNNRVTFDMVNGKVGEDDYYPYGLNVHREQNATNNYLYNKKELQAELTEYDYGARFYDPVIARWDVIDRFAAKYQSMTPYQYASLNPIRNVDINGDTVRINYNNQDILYEKGKLYNKDGSEYKGAGTKLNKDGSVKRYKGFLGDAVGALSDLSKSKAGKEEVSALESSSNTFTIKDAQLNPVKAGANQFIASDRAAAYAGEAEDQGDSPFGTPWGGSGGTIYFNPSDATAGTVSEVGGTGFHPETNLGHELFHAWDADRGLLNDAIVNGLNTSEWRATYYENQIRDQLGLPLRNEYNLKTGTVNILDANGKPIPVEAPAPIPPIL